MVDSILVIDDDPGAIQLMGRILEGVGEMRFATNGAEAMRLARELPPDLVLLDAEMPGMSGFKVFDAFKQIPDLADVPIIFVTGHSESEFEIGALDMGATDFFSKPVNPPLVKARVMTHLRGKRLADALRRIAATADAAERAADLPANRPTEVSGFQSSSSIARTVVSKVSAV